MASELFSEDTVEEKLSSRKSIGLYRAELLEKGDSDGDGSESVGFPALFLPILSRSIDDFRSLLSKPPRNLDDDDDDDSPFLMSKRQETQQLLRVLKMYRRISELDPTLDEEIGLQGAHLSLSKIIKIDMYSVDCCHTDNDDADEANQDMIIELQDLACEIAAFSKSFPLPASPLLHQDLVARLPLAFHIHPIANSSKEYETDGITVLINQVKDRQSAQKDVGFVMWPSAVVLSRWLASNPDQVRGGKTVLELGSGCGLTGLVAAKILKDGDSEEDSNLGRVVLSDFNTTVVKNLNLNIDLNNLQRVTTAEALDFYQQDPNGSGWVTPDGQNRETADIILAADVICQPEDAFALARTIASALKEGCKAIVVSADSKHRFGVEKLEEACESVGSLTILSKTNVDDFLSNVASEDEDMEKTSGFVPGMTLTMFIIQKNGEC